MSVKPHVLIAGRSEFHASVRLAFADAAEVGCRELWLCDNDFSDWPLSELEVIENLTRWAQSHRKLTVLAQNFEAFARRHTRWVEWRRQWAHVVECRTHTELEAGQFPTLLLAPGLLSVRLVDPIHYRGSVSYDMADVVRGRETVDALLQRSAEAFPVTTLGL